jgi:hypothetical protein
MTPQYILTKSLCREPHCASEPNWKQHAQSEIDNMNYAEGYAEPGYTDPNKCVLFANWNYFPRGIDSILENYGYAIEWSDEWSTCDGCNKAVRTSPDSYGWQPSYAIVNDCEILCADCLADNPTTALNMHAIAPAKWGYKMLQDSFENGLHPGQTDDPKRIYKLLTDAGHSRILFRIDSVGQFDMQFSVWEHTEES